MKSKAKTMMRNKSAADQRMQERLLLCPFSQSFAPGNEAHCKKTLNNRNSQNIHISSKIMNIRNQALALFQFHCRNAQCEHCQLGVLLQSLYIKCSARRMVSPCLAPLPSKPVISLDIGGLEFHHKRANLSQSERQLARSQAAFPQIQNSHSRASSHLMGASQIEHELLCFDPSKPPGIGRLSWATRTTMRCV